MTFELKRYPELGITLIMFSGDVSVDDVIKLFGSLDNRDAGRWLTYCDPTVTTGALGVDVVPRLKQLIADKQSAIFDGAYPRNAMVYASRAGEEFLIFWQRYTLTGDVHPMTPAIFSDFKAACDWLGLSEAAHAKLKAEVGRFEAEARSPGPDASGG